MISSDKPIVLIVDDTADNIDILKNVLHEQYSLRIATNGEKAIKLAYAHPQPDIILLDIMMPGTDGYEVCQVLKADPLTTDIPIIFITAKTAIEDETKGFELGAVDFISKPVSPPIVLSRIKTHLALYDQNRELNRKIREHTQEIYETRLAIIQKLGRAAEYKDNETGRQASLYKAFTAPEARRLLKKLEFNYTPKHASWLNMVEIEIGNMNQQCLNRRIGDRLFLISELQAWENRRNQKKASINWMFNVDAARTKLNRAYDKLICQN